MILRITLPLLLLLPACSGHASHGHEAAPTTVNALCPIMEESVDPDLTVEFDGKTVGFCCEDCIEEWNEMPTEKAVAALAAVQGSEESTESDGDGHEGHDH